MVDDGKGGEKPTALADLRFDPDAAATPFHDLLAHRQSNAGALVIPTRHQALEDGEGAIEVLGPDADPVVRHRDDPFVSLAPPVC